MCSIGSVLHKLFLTPNVKVKPKAKATPNPKKAATAGSAPIAKRPAAAAAFKRPATARPFDLDDWISEYVAEEAAEGTVRRYFWSKMHHRVKPPAKASGA